MVDEGREAKRHSLLFVTLYMKGATRLLTDTLRHVDREKYRSTILLLTGEIASAEETPDGTSIVAHDYFSTPWRKLAGIFAIAKLARDHDTIVGYSELTPTYMTIIGSFLAFKRPYGAVHVHLSTILRLGLRPSAHRWAISLFYPLLKKVIGCSDGVSKDLRDEFGLKKVVSIPNSVDSQRILTMASAAPPPEFDFLFRRPVVMAIGVLGFQKAHDVLLRAFARVKSEGYEHNLVIVGEGPDRGKLEALINELGLSGRAYLIGYLNNPYPLLKRAELFVLSSRFEGFAIVLAEAMTLKVPIVSTDCECGPSEVLAGGHCGMLVPVDDPEQLAESMIKVLSDPGLADRLRTASASEVVRRDVKKWTGPFIDVIAPSGGDGTGTPRLQGTHRERDA